ncbi:Ig-like domain-containing protein [Paraburkholderia sediminicola]|uniref:Ig-like domain-containing protein n=1 Tax=Paraburkholderia sediminicola TaxID=458836 RepID=UPI0038B93177
MRTTSLNKILRAGALLAMLTMTCAASAQVVVNLTAQRTTTALPDGSLVPMWGYCYTPDAATSASSPNAVSGGVACTTSGSPLWAPGPTITVPAGSGTTPLLTINLTNTLPTPTSIVVLGQIGGGLGAVTREASPQHPPQTVTWPAAGGNGATFTPPSQAARARSFAPEAAAKTTSATTASYAWTTLKPGTYLYETGSHPSIQAPMGLYGMLIVTAPADTSGAAPVAQAYPGIKYDAAATLLFSEIDPVQNAAVDAVAANAINAGNAISEYPPTGTDLSTCVLSPGVSAAAATCLPPAVNYSPRYFLINGRAFDPTAPGIAAFAVPGAAPSGNLLFRFANAGLRTHVPSPVGLRMSLIAEDGNPAPGNPKQQNEVLLTAGKTYDVIVKPPLLPGTGAPTYAPLTVPLYDRELSLTSGGTPNGGMQAFVQINSAGAAAGQPGGTPAVTSGIRAVNDVFTAAKGAIFSGNVITNDVGVTSVALVSPPKGGTVVFSASTPGAFVYTPNGGACGNDSFTYNGNGGSTNTATVSIIAGGAGCSPTVLSQSYASKVSSLLTVAHPGVLAGATDPDNLALSASLSATNNTCGPVRLLSDGSFTAQPNPAQPTQCSFQYTATNSRNVSSAPATVSLSFQKGTGFAVAVLDTQTRQSIPLDTGSPGSTGQADYSWVLEEDTTFVHSSDPQQASKDGTLATNFHRSYMPLIASGCTGARSCGDANTQGGQTMPALGLARARSFPGDVLLDPTKRYYLSVSPADAADGVVAQPNANPPVAAQTGHGMGGASIVPGAIPSDPKTGKQTVTVLSPQNPLPVANLSVFVFEDNNPTNGSVDEGEPGLGGFQVIIYDVRGSSGDAAGQMTYDLAGMPLRNGLMGGPGCKAYDKPVPVGTIYTCPNAPNRGPAPSRGSFPPGPAGTAAYLSALTAYNARLAQDAIDYKLAGMALVPNMIPGRVTVQAIPAASRSGAGEKWVQVSTLEGGKPVDTFVKAGEPSYWQEFGAPGFHSFIGFVNPDRVKATSAALCAAQPGSTANPCPNTVKGVISSLHMDRPPAANLNDSCATNRQGAGPADAACRATFQQTTCYVSLNTVGGTGQNVGYTECDANGNFTLNNIPDGTHELVIWDQWLDQIIAMQAVTLPDATQGHNVSLPHIPVFSWFTRVEQSAYMDLNKNGVRDPGEPGLSKVPLRIRFRDGSVSNFLSTDGNGVAVMNELFPLFNWYVLESDTTRYKGTGVSVAYDAGGKPDTSGRFVGVLNSTETFPLPTSLQVPNAIYQPGKTTRIDPGTTLMEGLQGYINQTAVIDWGKTPYNTGENGGINGLVFYGSTRGFDDPRREVQFSWEPAIPRVPVNLYRKTVNADQTTSLVLVDTTTTSSWDDFAASRTNPDGSVVPGINCPGNDPADPFVNVTLQGASAKCYDGQHSFNQVQPAVYDGRYRFPSATYLKAQPGGLPPGNYVVEVVPPGGYSVVKEEDKNILIGEVWNPLGETQFAGLGSIFILPDTATINSSNVAGMGLNFPPCVGALHRVPDSLALFPDAGQDAPFAGQDRPLCDRKEVTLGDQMQATADFQMFTQTPVAAHFVGMMLNDAAAEFDPVSPSFGEKAALPNAPVSIRDFNGVEIARTYNDKWGTFNGLAPSTLAANVPNPSGYSPNMLTSCMNDPGPIPDPTGAIDPITHKVRMIVDPLYNPMFSNFCYVWPYMPGSTVYLDTPVLPTSAYASASSYAPVDCQYPDATPAISRVDGDSVGPWVSGTGANHRLTIRALGDVMVANPAYAGPTSLVAETKSPKIKRHYGFGTARGAISINGVTVPAANITSWNDTTITLTVPNGATTGELSITAANGKKSVDAVTVTIETALASRPPKIVVPQNTYAYDPSSPSSVDTAYPHPVQDAIDAALPGDLIILDAGSYPELVTMWKPVRLQGVGAASVVINATKFPNRKLADWRARINALFGIDPIADTVAANPQIDPLPGQELTGGIVQLEPSALSTEEGAGITVLAKNGATGSVGCFNRNRPGVVPGFSVATSPDGSTKMTSDNVPLLSFKANPAWSNFACSSVKSSIDGVSVTGGDAGGGIYVNGWAHNLQIANNRVFGNAGPFSGGVRIGQPYLEGAVPALETAADGSILGYNKNVNIHHNAITTNGMVEGNAAAGATAAGGAGGGLSICSGTDNYKVNFNFICGNFASSDGGGVGHIGLSNNGVISYNQIVFNESFNQTSPQSGGGLVIEGEGATATALGLGAGNVTVDANLIQGNFARAGHGGGIRLQSVNGQDVVPGSDIAPWRVSVTNNMIVNNVAGWAGAGVSLADTLNSELLNNTIASNDSTGIVGATFNTTVGGVSTGPTTGVPNPAGISTELTSAALLQAARRNRQLQGELTISSPTIRDNIIWQNRSFFFDGTRGDKNVPKSTVSIIASNNWTEAATHSGATLVPQTSTGQCVGGAKYWDLGIVGDHSPVLTPQQLRLRPTYSVMTAETRALYGGNNIADTSSTNLLVKGYCNGSRVLPGIQFEPGTPFQPAFNLNAAATLDESGNFVDLHFGPISLYDPAQPTVRNGDYHLAGPGAAAYNVGTRTGGLNHDFDGQLRPQVRVGGTGVDIGADELVTGNPVQALLNNPALQQLGNNGVVQSLLNVLQQGN